MSTATIDSNQKTFGIKFIIKQAWKIGNSCKWPMLIMILFALPLQIILTICISHGFKQPMSQTEQFTHFMVTNIVLAPFMISALMVGVQRCRNQAVSYKTGFQYINRWPLIILGNLIITAPIWISRPWLHDFLMQHHAALALFLVIVLFYGIFASQTLPLIADKKMGIFSAWALSFKKVAPHWIKILLTIISAWIMAALSFALPALAIALIMPNIPSLFGFIVLGIIAIWALPFLMAVHSVIYHRLNDINEVKN